MADRPYIARRLAGVREFVLDEIENPKNWLRGQFHTDAYGACASQVEVVLDEVLRFVARGDGKSQVGRSKKALGYIHAELSDPLDNAGSAQALGYCIQSRIGLVTDSLARRRIYKSRGYTMLYADSAEQVRTHIKNKCL